MLKKNSSSQARTSQKQASKKSPSKRQKKSVPRAQNKIDFGNQLDWFYDQENIFSKMKFHGNTKWNPRHLSSQALIFSWSEKFCVTDAFDESYKRSQKLGIPTALDTYQGFIRALANHRDRFIPSLSSHLQQKMKDIAGSFWQVHGFVPIAFDGSRNSAPRTESNEQEFCASNHGTGKTAKYRKKKTKGMRRTQNEKNKPAAPKPQIWITMMWQMSLRLPWKWRLGPSNSSERSHVSEMIRGGNFPKKTLFCGDAGFVGYDFWRSILKKGQNFLVRVGANVSLLSENMDYKRLKDGTVLCWPKGKSQSDEPPLKLRLVQVKIGKTKMYLLTSVLDKQSLSKKQMIRFYKMRWGIEVEFRGLKQTLKKTNLRCRNSQRTYAELDWSIMAMAVAELFALKEQISAHQAQQSQAKTTVARGYSPHDRSLANTMRAIENCLAYLDDVPDPGDNLFITLRGAMTDDYIRKSKKKARYCPKNPDKKPLGDPKIRKLNLQEKKKRLEINQTIAA